MSKEGGSGGAGTQDAGGAPGDPAKDALYEARGPKKIVRIITVMAYMFSVSSVAIVLSAYYLFLWEPPNPRLLHSASRLREGPRIHYLQADPPQMKTHIHENLEDEYFNGNPVHDETSHKLGSYKKDYDDFYENLASLRSTLNDVLGERRNDSVIGQNLTEHVGNNRSSFDDPIKIDGERSQTLTGVNVNVRKDTPQEAKFIPGDKSGINDNTAWTLPHRRKEKDSSEDPTTTVQQVSEYIVKRHQFLWNTTNNELIRSNDKSNYDDSRNTNKGGRENEKKDAKTTGKSPSVPPRCRTSSAARKTNRF